MANNCTPQVQAVINDLYRLKPWQAQTGILDFAFSAMNDAQIQPKMINKNGMNSTYSITYPAELCNAVIDCGDEACDAAKVAVIDFTVCDVLTSFSCKKQNVFRFLFLLFVT